MKSEFSLIFIPLYKIFWVFEVLHQCFYLSLKAKHFCQDMSESKPYSVYFLWESIVKGYADSAFLPMGKFSSLYLLLLLQFYLC